MDIPPGINIFSGSSASSGKHPFLIYLVQRGWSTTKPPSLKRKERKSKKDGLSK
jgi:hypothetical protein